MDEREKVPGEQTAHAIDRPLRPARAPRAQRRSAAGFSRLRFHYDASDELSVHRQIQAHQITTRSVMSSEVSRGCGITAALQSNIRDSSTSLGMTNATKIA